jgi:serine/threonine-protein kinase
MLTGVAPLPVVDHLEPLPSACHPDMTPAHDAALAQLLQDDPRKRPGDAFEARRLLLGLSWPERIWERPRRARPVTERPPGPSNARLGTALSIADGEDGALRQHDTWLDRDVVVLPVTPLAQAQARSFARAGHPSLPTVLRVDQETSSIWVAVALGRSLADEPRPLSPGLVARLGDAVRALHASGGAHGRIDPAHIHLFAGDVALAYPRDPPSSDETDETDETDVERWLAAARARDLTALAELGGEGGTDRA